MCWGTFFIKVCRLMVILIVHTFFLRMSDFIRDSLSSSVQRVNSEEWINNIQLGSTIGETDWAWENIFLERQLRLKIEELQQLQSEHAGMF